MTLEQSIAKALATSQVGLFRKQIFEKIDQSLAKGNIDNMSVALTKMSNAGHVDKSLPVPKDGSRWKLTPKGRAAYSVLHDDEHESSSNGPDQSEDLSEGKLSNHSQTKVKTVHFNTDDELDRGLFGIVELIRGVASQPAIAIENKTDCINELEKLEHAEFLSGRTRSAVAKARAAIELMDDQA